MFFDINRFIHGKCPLESRNWRALWILDKILIRNAGPKKFKKMFSSRNNRALIFNLQNITFFAYFFFFFFKKNCIIIPLNWVICNINEEHLTWTLGALLVVTFRTTILISSPSTNDSTGFSSRYTIGFCLGWTLENVPLAHCCFFVHSCLTMSSTIWYYYVIWIANHHMFSEAKVLRVHIV